MAPVVYEASRYQYDDGTDTMHAIVARDGTSSHMVTSISVNRVDLNCVSASTQ